MIPQSIFITTAVIAVTQVVKFVRAKDWDSLITIASAVIIGGVAGALGIEGLTLTSGIMSGLAAVGVFSVAEAISNGKQ